MSDDAATVSTTDTEAQEPPGFRESMHLLRQASTGFWLVNQVNFGDGIAYFGVLTLMTLFMQRNVGFETSDATLSVSVFMGLVTLFMLGAGSVTDWLGARRALSLSLAIVLVGRVLLVMSPGAGSMVGAVAWTSIVVMGFGEGMIQPALYAGAKEYADKRTATMAYAFLYSVMNLGIVVGELFSPLVRGWYAASFEGKDVQEHPTAGITGAFWFFIGVTAIVLLVNILFFNERVEKRDRVVPARPKAEKEARQRFIAWLLAALSGLPRWLANLPIFSDLRFSFFIFILLPVRTLFAHQWLTMPDYVTRCFPSWVAAKWEWVSLINPLVIVIAVPIFAALTGRRRVVDMMIVGTAITAGSTFLLAGEPNLVLLVTYIVFFTLGEAVWSSRFLEYIAEIAPRGRLGIYMGIAGLPWFLAKTVTGTYAGHMLDLYIPKAGTQAPEMLWLTHGGLAVVSPLALIAGRRWLLHGEKRALATKAEA